MKCKEVTQKIDSREIPTGIFGRMEFWFHLAICRACTNYLRFSLALRKAFHEYMGPIAAPTDLEKILQALLNKFAKK